MLVVPNPIEWPEYITKQENQEYAEMLKKDCQRDLEKRYSAINEINLSKDYSPLAKNDHTIIIPIKTEENKYPLCVKFYGRNIESYSEENYGI